jgi:integrase
MASITKTSSGYRAQVYVKGARDTKCFRTRREAAAWAAVRDAELRAEAGKTPTERHTLRAAIERYRADVSPTKRGARWENVRLTAFLDSTILPITSPLGEVTPDMLGKWRDSRLQQVSAGTVLREFGLLSAVFEEARREWRWLAINPVSDVRKPRQPDHREVVITRSQIKAMLQSLGYSPTLPPRSVSQAVAAAFLLALRTGMREGEICGLTWERVHEGYCQTPHKTGAHGTSLRDVPLTPKAKRIINKMRGFDRATVFGVGVQSLGTMFKRARIRAGMNGFTFHDARHTAATWLAQRLNILDLCKVFGWKNPKMAMVYYNPKASDIAKRMS